eukprot:1187152-Rhodomonas_salina.2
MVTSEYMSTTRIRMSHTSRLPAPKCTRTQPEMHLAPARNAPGLRPPAPDSTLLRAWGRTSRRTLAPRRSAQQWRRRESLWARTGH